MNFYITYAGETNIEHGLMVYSRPDYPAPEENITEHEIPGRSSNLTERSGRYDNDEISYVFNYAVSENLWGKVFREAILWLRKDGDLIQSDDTEIYRKVLYVKIDTNSRTLKRIGKFEATFVCAPGMYLLSGADFCAGATLAKETHYFIDGEEVSAGYVGITSVQYVIENDYSECQPVYKLIGGGTCELTVNGKTVTAIVGAYLMIDSDKKETYMEYSVLSNTSITGDYDDLVLQPGENTIEITNGFDLEIQPNWRVL